MKKNKTIMCHDEDMLKVNYLMHKYICKELVNDKVDDLLNDKENTNFDLWCYILKGDYNKIEKVADRVMVDASFEIATGKCYDVTEEILENVVKIK